MADIMLNIKFLMFYALEFAVVALVATLVIAGLYEVVRSKVTAMRHVASKSRTPAPATVRKD